MLNNNRKKTISRRKAIRRIAVGTAGIVAAPRIAFGQSGPTGGGAIHLERQATGSEIWQVTTGKFNHSNIYCEVPYCSADSRYFVYIRRNPELPGKNTTELMVVELGTWKQHRLDVTTGILGLAITPAGVLYYIKEAAGNTRDLMRADLSEGKPKNTHRFQNKWTKSLGTISADGRYYLCGKRMDEKFTMFGVLLVDLKTGQEAIIDQDPFILNPHPQFDPGNSRRAMIQHNRGGKFKPDGKLERLVGPEGATLYCLSVPDGKRTELQVGKPFTTPVTGHEAWIGETGEMLLTVSPSGDYAPAKGNLLGVRAGQPPRVVAKGYKFGHVGATRCGRFFSCDDWREPYKVVIGSTKTGRTAVVCESKSKPGGAQNTHPHPYLTPDLKWVIFNSNRSGFAHVHAASVPDGMIAELSKT